MPRVEWPQRRWQKRHVRRRAGWSLLATVVIVVTVIGSVFYSGSVLLRPKTAHASTILPDPTGNTDPMSLLTSVSQYAGTLNSPEADVKFYLNKADVGTAGIQIWNAPYNACQGQNAGIPIPVIDFHQPGGTFCADSPMDPTTNNPTSPLYTMIYDFYATDASENVAAVPFLSINGQTGAMSTGGTLAVPNKNWSGTIQVPVGTSPISNLTGYRVIYVKAHFQDPVNLPPGTEVHFHSFQLQVTNTPLDKIGYVNTPPTAPAVMPASGMYNIHYIGPNGSYDVANTEIDFAPSCSVNSPQTAQIRWYDADASPISGGDGARFPGDIPPWFELKELDSSNTVVNNWMINNTTRTVNGQTLNIGGNNQYREFDFTAQPGHKYQWIWHDMDSAGGGGGTNNIEMWVPYDSVFYDIACWQYGSTITNAPGTVAGGPVGAPAPLDFSNPANYTNMTFQVNVYNSLGSLGPAVYIDPKLTVGSPAWTPGGFTIGWDTGIPTTVPILCPTGSPPGCVPGIPGGATLNNVGQFKVSLSPTTPDGSIICFGDVVRPVSVTQASGPSDLPDQCYRVQNSPRFPTFQAHGSDIHAGGGICGNTPEPPPNYLLGNAAATGANASFDDYVVSAEGMSSDVGSNGAGGDTSLDVGRNGAYVNLCRPDIYGYATTHMNGAVWTPGPVTIAVGTVPATTSTIFVSGDASVRGTTDHPLTIIASGNITVLGPGTAYPGATSPRGTVPILGLVAHGDIGINQSANSVAAVMFSDGTINTCKTLSLPAPGVQCQDVLNIFGFMMSKNLELRRMGPAGTLNAQVGEIITMDPDIYLNPPPYFDSSVNSISLEGLGERQPRF